MIIRGAMGEKKTFTCQNPSCKITFTTPLKTINLQENPTEPYYACPFCLTKIESSAAENSRNIKPAERSTTEARKTIPNKTRLRVMKSHQPASFILAT